MSDPLGRRCTLVLLAALAVALATGLLAWGPVPLDPIGAHADRRPWLGLPNGVTVLANLPLLVVGCWGLRVTRDSAWPAPLRRAWMAFHACAALAAALGVLYHLNPLLATWLPAKAAMSAAFAMLAVGALAERVHARLASPPALALVGVGVLLAALVVAVDGAHDLRPFLLIETLPVLLLPAGALSLPGTQTRSGDWVVMLACYVAAKLAELCDGPLLAATGWISGHALMHLLLAAGAAWLAYCAARAPAEVRDAGVSQRQTSLNTAG